MSHADVMPSLSIIIPHSGEARAIQNLLESIEKQIVDFPTEILVICNGAGHAVSWTSAKFEIRWLQSSTGANSARQVGVENARGSVYLFLDDDCVLEDKNLLQWHYQWHREHPNATGVGGTYALTDESDVWAKTYHFIQQKWLYDHLKPDGTCLHLLGGHLSLKSEIFEEQGFDTKIRFGGTETEFQIRLALTNRYLYFVPTKFVLHGERLGLKSFLSKSFKQGMGHAYIESLHRRPRRFVFHPSRQDHLQAIRPPKFFENLYRFVFSLGGEFYREKNSLVVSQWEIRKRIILNSYRFLAKPIFSREWRDLGKLISIRFF